MPLKIAALSLICLVVNIPLGMKRERSKKFSLAWFLWIHASIPFIIAARIMLQLHPIAIPLNIAAAVAGQFIGGSPEKKRRKAALPSAS